MLSAGGSRIAETRFYAPGGRSFAVPSRAFGGNGFALSLSRAEMDMRLLRRARSAGVTVFEDSNVNAVSTREGRIVELSARCGTGDTLNVGADLFVDATGRAGVLTKLAAKSETDRKRSNRPNRSLYIGFKAHLKGQPLKGDVRDLPVPGGYGGLSPIEAGQANHCFLSGPPPRGSSEETPTR